MPAALRLRWRGQAWFEHAGLPASGSWGTSVSVGLRSVGGRGMVPTGSQLSEVVVQIRGGSVIFGPLTGQLAGSAVWAHALVGAVARARRAPVGGPFHKSKALLLALAE